MRVLLIHPPDSKQSIAPGRFEPLALEVLAATIPGHEVQIIDLRFDTFKGLSRRIRSFKPSVIGVTVNNTIHVINAHKTLEFIRETAPEAKVVIGGYHPSMLPDDFRKAFVDAIFYGWAEKSFPQFIDALSRGDDLSQIPGIEILEDGKTVSRTENQWDLNPSDIPFPRRDLVRQYIGKYRSDMGFRTSLVNTSRGCPNRCRFCGVWKVTKGKFLLRDPGDICREIINLPYRIRYVFFADDNTFIDPARAMKLAQLLKSSGIKKKYSGYCRSDTIVANPDLMKIWGEIGLKNLCVGFEVVDDERLQALNKGNLVSNNEKAAAILNEIGIPFRPHFLIEPSFGMSDFENILCYVKNNNLMSPIYPILTPIPGSPDYNEVKDSIHMNYNYFDYAHAVVPTKLKPSEFYWAWIRLYIRSYPVKKNLWRFLKRRFAIITSNERLEKSNHHLRLKNLFFLKIFSLFLMIKLVRHYRMEEKMLADRSQAPFA